MAELGWKEAIVEVLKRHDEPMHYTDISDSIAELALRENFGATPSSTVNATIVLSMRNESESSPFMRVSRGVYALRTAPRTGVTPPGITSGESEETVEAGFINAFGMYWSRENVLWISTPRILGQQQAGSQAVDFCNQKGVYLLHDGRSVVYVGRTTEQPLGIRLRQHISDRLGGRWNRFSWFGIFPATDNGTLNTTHSSSSTPELLIATMEALLIEGLEPPQNRKRGDDFRAVEFLQVVDPDIEKNKTLELIEILKTKVMTK